MASPSFERLYERQVMSDRHTDLASKRLSISSLGEMLKGARYLGILAALLAVGWFGHQTHWTFQHASDHGSPTSHAKVHASELKPSDTTTAKKLESEGSSESWNIDFPSERSLEISGIGTTPLELKPIVQRVRTTGVIAYDDRLTASLSARTTGTVWQVCKHVGETIRKGDVLVIVDAAEVGRHKSEFLTALVAQEAKAEILANLESITSGAVPQRQVREARVALREAKIRVLNAEQTLVNLGFSIQAEDFEKLGDTERAARIQFLGLPESLAKDLDRDKTTSNLLSIRATFDGVVLRQDVALGETAEAGKPILEIADTRHMWVKLDVPKEDASKLALGQKVTFTPDGIEQDLHGSITWISTEMNEQTRTLQVRAEVENPIVSSDPKSGQEVRLLRANTFGTGTVILQDNPAALVVPISAVLHDDKQPLVFVRTGDLSFARVDIETGIRDGKMVELRSGALHVGSEIVTKGGHVLKSEWTLNHVASNSP